MIKDLMRFRDKDKRDLTALGWLQDEDINITDFHLFETNYEFMFYIIYDKK